MTDENSNNDRPSGSYDEKFVNAMVEAMKRAGVGGDPSSAISAKPDKDGAVLMMEMNPALRFIVAGKIEEHRYMTLQGAEEWGEGQIRIWLPTRAFGPQGFQISKCRKLILYMTMDEYDASITGKFMIDLTQQCIPREIRASFAKDLALGIPKVGTKMSDGTIYVGRLPGDPDMAMLAEPKSEALRDTFAGAQKRARKRSLETGQDYRVPSREEWETIFEYRKYNGKLLGGFNKVSQIMDAWYWTSNAKNPFLADSVNTIPQMTVDLISHRSHLFSKTARSRRLGVRLIKVVPIEALAQMKP